MPTSEKGVVSGGSLLMSISNEIVQAKKRFFGKGPTKARSYFFDDILLVVLRGGLTVAEQTMVDAGQEHAVREFRQSFQAETSEGLKRAISRLTGRTVINHQSQVMFDPDVAVEIFVFADRLPHDVIEGAIEITPELIQRLTSGEHA